MGFTGAQMAESAGVDLGDMFVKEFKYLDGRCRHYKLIGESGYNIFIS